MLADYLTVVVASGRLKDLFNYSREGKQILFMYRWKKSVFTSLHLLQVARLAKTPF